MILDSLRPEPHPLRDFFKRQRVTYAMLARHCRVSTGWIGQLMAGYRPMPRHIEAQLYSLRDVLERQQGQVAR